MAAHFFYTAINVNNTQFSFVSKVRIPYRVSESFIRKITAIINQNKICHHKKQNLNQHLVFFFSNNNDLPFSSTTFITSKAIQYALLNTFPILVLMSSIYLIDAIKFLWFRKFKENFKIVRECPGHVLGSFSTD
ncbi:CLUMA_CG014716, isoform A [Clunio marinus]|uniref:CLUMA_CG014716, isoform A n=1 Tax=Clunio marinus TaxID=568069 RepID=A0A1J1IL82_9DIPT|nr:CLUMA_CG014716, isoform A [Clunio marinus]